jgi:hypothetical protein
MPPKRQFKHITTFAKKNRQTKLGIPEIVDTIMTVSPDSESEIDRNEIKKNGRKFSSDEDRDATSRMRLWKV